jgi:predicted RNase H-like HicB family nuclease
MERIVQLHIKKLPEGVFLATSDEIQGLVAQGRTLWETIEIARDVARKLVEAQTERRREASALHAVTSEFDYPMVLEY